MRGARLAAVVGLGLLLAACGGQTPAVAGHPRATPSAAPRRAIPPALLVWNPGQTFTAAVTFDEQDTGAVDDELRFTAQERFRVVHVRARVATVQLAVTGWRWQRNTSALLTVSLPTSSTFGVEASGKIVSGVDWPLPSELPLPGLDVFAGPLTAGTGWSRTDGEGVALSYQATVGSAPGEASLQWSLVRPQFTMSGEPITVSGRAEATLSSRYERRGTTAVLRSTWERATFQRTTQAAAGTTQESGTILETTAFSWP